MKKIFAFTTFILSSVAWGSTPINMACITEWPTTSFVAFTEGEMMTIRFLHHNGVQYMPVWNNVITPNDLPTITEAANTLSELGNDWEFTMPKSACEKLDGMMISCFGTQPAVMMNGHKVSLWAVHTSETFDRSFAGEFSYVNASLALDVDGKTYHVPMKYNAYECIKDLGKNGLKKHLRAKNLFLK